MVTILLPFICSVLLAGLLAIVFSPFLRYFKDKGLGRRTSTFILTFTIFLLGFMPLGLIILKGINIITTILAGPNLIYRKDIYIYKLYELIDKFALKINYDSKLVREKFEDIVLIISKWALNLFSNFLSQIPNISMMSFITILSFYFFLLNEKKYADGSI